MITPFPGAAFTLAADGDMRHGSRRAVSHSLGISDEWATVHQVHGADIHRVSAPGPAGDGDGLVTDTPGLPIAVFTADCLGVVLVSGEGAGGAGEPPALVGVAHAGWRGLVSGTVTAVASAMADAGSPATRVVIGPGIGPCCFEVGDEVAARFAPEHRAETSWGTPSVDLRSAAAAQFEMSGVDLTVIDACTRCEAGHFSHRRDGTPMRMAAIGWIP